MTEFSSNGVLAEAFLFRFFFIKKSYFLLIYISKLKVKLNSLTFSYLSGVF